MFKKKIVSLVTVSSLSALFALSSLNAAESKAAEMKIGIVEFQKALTSVDEGKAMKSKLEKEFNDKKKALDVKEAKVGKLKTELEEMNKKIQNPAMVSPDFQATFKKKFEEYQKEAMAFQQEYDELMKDSRQKEMTATQEIIAKLQGVAADIARSKAFSLILEKSAGVVYASSDVPDLTESVIQAYNQKHKGKGSDSKEKK